MSVIYKGINIGLATSSIGVLAILLLGITHVFALSDSSRKFNYRVFICEMLANFSDLLVTVLEGTVGSRIRMIMVVSSNLTYVFLLLAEFSVLQYVMSAITDTKFYTSFKKRIVLEYALFNALILFNSITGSFFDISERNLYVYAEGLLWLVPFLICSVPLFELYYILYYIDHDLSDEKVQAFSIFVLIPIVSGILTAWEDEISFFPFITTFCCIILTFYLFSEELTENVMRRQKTLENNNKLFLARLAPHFLYNALSSMSQLCKMEPKEASEIIDHFAEYMRINLNDIHELEMVPFQQELELTEHYLEIEKARYGDYLWAGFELETTDFMIPAMVLLPLVDNAVTHGVSKKEEGGNVFVSTKDCHDHVELVIEDDGMGFHVSEIHDLPEKYIVVRDVITRIEAIEGAAILFESDDEGTKVTISLPLNVFD